MLSRKDLPNFGVLKHISYDPDYAIQTCQRLGLFNFLNSGLNHAAENLSKDYRLHLVIDVSGQHELKHLEAISGVRVEFHENSL